MHANIHGEGIDVLGNSFPSLCGIRPMNPHMKPGVKPGMKPGVTPGMTPGMKLKIGWYYETGYEIAHFSRN